MKKPGRIVIKSAKKKKPPSTCHAQNLKGASARTILNPHSDFPRVGVQSELYRNKGICPNYDGDCVELVDPLLCWMGIVFSGARGDMTFLGAFPGYCPEIK